MLLGLKAAIAAANEALEVNTCTTFTRPQSVQLHGLCVSHDLIVR